MKKGLLYLSLVALMGAASLTACVNNEESASITALRDAKSEQLKSIAAMNNATAAVDSAQAAINNAKAKVDELEFALKKAKQDATLAESIKTAVQQAEKDLLTAQTELLNAQTAYQTALDLYEAARAKNPNPYLDALVTKYKDATIALGVANTMWQTAKTNLVNAETAYEADPTPANKQAVEEAKKALTVAQINLDVCQGKADFFKAEIDKEIKK